MRGGAGGTSRDRDVIRADEIATIQAATAYDIVRRLRSDFLTSRGTVTRTTGGARATQVQPAITVFIDGIEAGPLESALAGIPAIEVEEIHLYRAVDAATKFGSRHNGGVITVTTRRHEP